MGSNDALAERVRAGLADVDGITEKAMFGGMAFLLHGHLTFGASKRGLLVRVGKERYAEALTGAGVRVMEMKGRALAGYVFVDPTALTARALRRWLDLGLSFVATLPAKSAAKPARRRAR